MTKDVMLVLGAGEIGRAIARRMGSNMKIIFAVHSLAHTQAAAKLMTDTGFDVEAVQAELGDREGIKRMIAKG
jgi:saccharopine dehydrogenase-like NADP-dependent oxidoreductase